MKQLDPAMLESMFGDKLDDRARQILHILTTRDDGESNGEEDIDERELDNRAGLGRSHSRGRILRLLQEEVEELRHRNDNLAQALGACPNCWGESEDCEDCEGRGKPGAYEIDRALYAAVVAPVAESHVREPRIDVRGAMHRSTNPENGN